MKFRKAFLKIVFLLTMAAVVFQPSVSMAESNNGKDNRDFGVRVERLLKSQSELYFGIEKPLGKSAPKTTGSYRREYQDAEDQVLLAKGLKVEYLTRNAANVTDMMAFFPAENPTHLITCVEGGRGVIGYKLDFSPKYNPSVQRINLSDGTVETILRGMNVCDGIRTTPWGTILATEETSDGGAYEILNPLSVTEQTVVNRASGDVSDANHIVKRTALPTMAWEGLEVLPSGVVIAGDELRPGTTAPDADGGAIFKFIPANIRTGSGNISNLNESPLAAGNVYAMQISCRDDRAQTGQGCEVGNGTWVQVNAATARYDAHVKGATGYYRPEDLHRDPMFKSPEHPNAVRFCWTNTGNEDVFNYAEVMCGGDFDPTNPKSTVIVNRFVEGDQDFNSFDNLEFQPRTGNLYVIEDHENGDIFACLPNGADRDIKSDGCVKILSVKDSSAEPTGFIFSEDGTTAYLSIQHSDDGLMPKYDDYPTDDVVRITGFKIHQ